MPNLTPVEVAKAHLAAKEKEKQATGKRTAQVEATRKKKGAQAKGNQAKATENNEPDTNEQGEPIQKEDNALPDPDQQV